MINIKHTTLILSTLTATLLASAPAPAVAGTAYDTATFTMDSTSTTTTTIDTTPIDDGTYPDDGTETVNEDTVSAAFFAVLALPLVMMAPPPPPDNCLNNWNALILAKSNWLKVVIGSALVGWALPPVAAGIIAQKTGALIDARKLMRACCAVPGPANAGSWSCREAVRDNYLK
jgi:hypothetical protein